jgi:hypothetical protein
VIHIHAKTADPVEWVGRPVDPANAGRSDPPSRATND